MKPLLIFLVLHLVSVGAVGYGFSTKTVRQDPPVLEQTGEIQSQTLVTRTYHQVPSAVIIYGLAGLLVLGALAVLRWMGLLLN